jgi:PTS system cellobiose-specific IIB component
MKILVACALGMSTSLLVAKMKQAAAEKNIDADIQALPVAEGIQKVKEMDIVLLGPQVRFQRGKFEQAAAGKTPIQVIDMAQYGMVDGEAILLTALKAIEEAQK